jgi:hypothetical protein
VVKVKLLSLGHGSQDLHEKSKFVIFVGAFVGAFVGRFDLLWVKLVFLLMPKMCVL